MAILNHNLLYRPIRGGIAILNPIVNKIGTLGFIATADGKDRWIVSCYHVLGRIDLSPFVDGEPIYQPVDGGSLPVAKNCITRTDAALDCAAALLQPDIVASAEILGLMPLAQFAEPVVGMRVIKSGSTTGVTEGIVTDVQGDSVEIGLPNGFPATYELCGEGDSGALWVDRSTGAGIALHHAGTTSGSRKAFGIRITQALKTLNLSPVLN